MKRFKNILLPSLLVFLFFFLFSTPSALAALQNPLGAGTTPATIIGRIIKAVLGLSGIIALLMFVYGGVLYMLDMGEGARMKKGKDAIKNAVIGLIIIFTSYTLVDVVLQALGQ